MSQENAADSVRSFTRSTYISFQEVWKMHVLLILCASCFEKEHVYSSKLRCWNVERGFAFSKIRMHGIYQASHTDLKQHKKIQLEVRVLFFSQPLWHQIWVAVKNHYSNPQLTRGSSLPSAGKHPAPWSYQVPGVIPPSSWLTRWNDILKMSFHSLRPSVDPRYKGLKWTSAEKMAWGMLHSARWWFQIYFLCSPLPGEDSHSD